MADDKNTEDPRAVNARQLLAQADAELGQRIRARPKMPERPFVTGVVSFLGDPPAAFNLLVFSLWINVLVNVAHGIFVFSNDAGQAQIMAVFLTALLTVTGLPFVLWFSAICLAVARDSASGLKTIETWPGLDITECISLLPYTLLSSFLAVTPGYVLGQLLVLSGASIWVAVVACLASTTILYPVALLSTLKSGSPIGFFSVAIVQSLNTSLGTWCRFYFLSAGLVLLGGFAVWLIWITWFLLGFLWTVPLIAATMVYHRLLGRLAWVLAAHADKEAENHR